MTLLYTETKEKRPRIDISKFSDEEKRNMEREADDKIARVRANIAFSHIFWGYLLCSLESKPLYNGFGTLATDGYFLYYDPYGYLHHWSDEELEFAILHEISHCAFGHYWRCGNRNKRIWNIATDYIINWILVNNEKLKMPEDPQLLYENKYDETLSAEVVYADLMIDRDAAMEKLKQLLEDADLFEDCIGNEEGNDEDGCGKSIEELTGGMVTEGDIRDEQWWKDKVQSAQTYAKSRGTMPSYLEHLIGELVEPALPWKEILREYITSNHNNDFRMLPANKRFLWQDVCLPSVKGNHLELAVALDTSGSISDSVAQQFLSEVRAIAEVYDSFEIHYMQCDADVKFYQVLTNEDEDNWPMQIVGRGGTRFEPVFQKLEEEDYEPPLLIYMTDGMGSFPEQPLYNVLWISDNERSKYPWGDVLVVDIHDDRL